MGILKDHAEGKGIDHENDPERLEEQYQKMFMKIGRDFVHQKDFDSVVEQILQILAAVIPGLGTLIDNAFATGSLSGARSVASTYKKALEEGEDLLPFAKADLQQIDNGE